MRSPAFLRRERGRFEKNGIEHLLEVLLVMPFFCASGKGALDICLIKRKSISRTVNQAHAMSGKMPQ